LDFLRDEVFDRIHLGEDFGQPPWFRVKVSNLMKTWIVLVPCTDDEVM